MEDSKEDFINDAEFRDRLFSGETPFEEVSKTLKELDFFIVNEEPGSVTFGHTTLPSVFAFIRRDKEKWEWEMEGPPKKRSYSVQLWEPCPKCGKEPIYLDNGGYCDAH